MEDIEIADDSVKIENIMTLSQQPSEISKTNNTITIGTVASKPLALPQVATLGSSKAPLTVKREENKQNIIMDKLRKKVCRKIFSILRDQYKIPTADAKEVTLNLEERVNLLYPSYSSAKHYINTVKILFTKLKVEIVRLTLEQRDDSEDFLESFLSVHRQVQYI